MFANNAKTCNKTPEILYNLDKRIQLSLNNIIDSGQVPNGWEDRDKDIFIALRIDLGSGMKEAYQACIKACLIWTHISTPPDKSSKNKKHRNRFLYVQNSNKQ